MIEPVALLKDLVRINTTNPPGEEEKLLLYLERILQEHGIPYVYQKSAKGRRKSAGMAAGRSGRRGTVDPDESYRRGCRAGKPVEISSV